MEVQAPAGNAKTDGVSADAHMHLQRSSRGECWIRHMRVRRRGCMAASWVLIAAVAPKTSGKHSVNGRTMSTAVLGALRSPPAPWLVASWNQHRKSSYLQKDCSWISRLLALGHSKAAINGVVSETRVEYSPLEVQQWVGGYDVIALQEVDPLLHSALGPSLAGELIHGHPDRDGRGIVVNSTAALLLHPGRGLKAIRSERTTLQLRSRVGGKLVSRDHMAVLVERVTDGQRAVFCSVHLHPPSQIESCGKKYLRYLEPLQNAISRSGAATGTEVQLPCFLVGDFNVAPAEFLARTDGDPFWRQFEVCTAEGGDTAHCTNPAASGDFALSLGGVWQGAALGQPDFSAYERYVERVTVTANRRLRLTGALEACRRAAISCEDALAHVGSVAPSPGGEAGNEQNHVAGQPHAAEPALATALDASRRGQRRLTQQLNGVLARRHRKGILTSDHRPLQFAGYLPLAVVDDGDA